MCSPKVFLRKGKEEILLMEDVQSIVWENTTRFLLTNLLGKTTWVEGKIVSMDLLNHHIIIEGDASD